MNTFLFYSAQELFNELWIQSKLFSKELNIIISYKITKKLYSECLAVKGQLTLIVSSINRKIIFHHLLL